MAAVRACSCTGPAAGPTIHASRSERKDRNVENTRSDETGRPKRSTDSADFNGEKASHAQFRAEKNRRYDEIKQEIERQCSPFPAPHNVPRFVSRARIFAPRASRHAGLYSKMGNKKLDARPRKARLASPSLFSPPHPLSLSLVHQCAGRNEMLGRSAARDPGAGSARGRCVRGHAEVTPRGRRRRLWASRGGRRSGGRTASRRDGRGSPAQGKTQTCE